VERRVCRRCRHRSRRPASAAPSLSGSRLLPRDFLASGASCDLGGEDVIIDFTDPAAEQVVLEIFTGPSTASIDLTAPKLVLEPSGGSLVFGDKGLCNPRLRVAQVALNEEARRFSIE
jgi:hypothetical protein